MRKKLLGITAAACSVFTFSLLSTSLQNFFPAASAFHISAPAMPLSLPEAGFDSGNLIFMQSISSASPPVSDVYNNGNASYDTEETRAASAIPKDSPLPEDITETEILKGGTSLFGVEINNETDYDLKSCQTDVAVSENPTVLIVHTHTSEAYRPSECYPYTPTDNSRTENTDFNVARVGKELASALTSYGINVIHDSSLNDYPSYNGSYKNTLTLMESHLEKNPSIDIIIDLHRDAMERTDGTKISTVCTADNEKAAQVMLVVGTDQGGLPHPLWKENFSFAVRLQTILNSKYPHMARPINVRKERFNGHVLPKEIIVEVGTTGNTLDEALISARALASAINEFYTG